MNLKSNKGFSLIELMVTVGIIGIISLIAIPNFQKFQSKAKGANAKAELSSIYGMQKAFQTEFGTYHSNLVMIGYIPDGIPVTAGTGCPVAVGATWPTRYYSVGFSAEGVVGNVGGVTEVCSAARFISFPNKGVAAPTTALGTAPATTIAPTAAAFQLAATGTVGGTLSDIWTIDNNKQLLHAQTGY